MKLLVTGGRHYGERDGEPETLNRLLGLLMRPGDTLIEGGADGADELAWQWFCDRADQSMRLREYWIDNFAGNRHQRGKPDPRIRYFRCGAWSEGKHVGPARNTRMLEESGADLVLAFPGGTGTEDLVRKALRAVTVLRVER